MERGRVGSSLEHSSFSIKGEQTTSQPHSLRLTLPKNYFKAREESRKKSSVLNVLPMGGVLGLDDL